MKPYYYVQRVGDRAAVVKQSTIESAVAESQWLAKLHPGEHFEILQCIAITHCTEPNTFWMDGCGPEPDEPDTLQPDTENNLPNRLRQLEVGEIIEQGDLYDSGDGLKPTGCQGEAYKPKGYSDQDFWHNRHFRTIQKEPDIPTAPEDPTMREVPIPDEYLPLPPLPEGKTRWVGRGVFEDAVAYAGDRTVFYWWGGTQWLPTATFSSRSPTQFHIEAV